MKINNLYIAIVAGLGIACVAAIGGFIYLNNTEPSVPQTKKTVIKPDWSDKNGFEAAKKIAASPRLADVANYLLTSANHAKLTANDILVLNAVEKEIQQDDVIAQAFLMMRQQGYPAEVVKVDGGYEIRGEWYMEAKAGGPFSEMFPNGARMLLNGESIPYPNCPTGKKPVVFHALIYKKGATKVETSLVEEGGRWRAFVDAPNPYAYRVLADAGCVPENKLDALAKPKQEDVPLVDPVVNDVVSGAKTSNSPSAAAATSQEVKNAQSANEHAPEETSSSEK